MAVKTPHPIETATPQVVATVLLAELIGKLNIVEGCVRVIDRVDNVSRLLVWPPDFEVWIDPTNGGTTFIRDIVGEPSD